MVAVARIRELPKSWSFWAWLLRKFAFASDTSLRGECFRPNALKFRLFIIKSLTLGYIPNNWSTEAIFTFWAFLAARYTKQHVVLIMKAKAAIKRHCNTSVGAVVALEWMNRSQNESKSGIPRYQPLVENFQWSEIRSPTDRNSV